MLVFLIRLRFLRKVYHTRVSSTFFPDHDSLSLCSKPAALQSFVLFCIFLWNPKKVPRANEGHGGDETDWRTDALSRVPDVCSNNERFVQQEQTERSKLSQKDQVWEENSWKLVKLFAPAASYTIRLEKSDFNILKEFVITCWLKTRRRNSVWFGVFSASWCRNSLGKEKGRREK